MLKIGEFIYPWGSGHYSRMMRLNAVLDNHIKEKFEVHFSSKDHVYQKLLEKFPEHKDQIHEILMPTPIDGKFGPSVSLSLLNLLLPVSKNPPLVKQVTSYLRQESKLYDDEKFDLVINDGDMGSNIIAKNRQIPSLFITNQFRPKLYKSRSYFYPAIIFISKQIAKASRILVADSPPPYT
ncbi:MAG: glycosyltransferase, partial [Nitrosarchaeum sp.]